MTVSMVLLMIWKVYWSSCRSSWAPMNVKMGITLWRTRLWGEREKKEKREGKREGGRERKEGEKGWDHRKVIFVYCKSDQKLDSVEGMGMKSIPYKCQPGWE